MASYHMSLKGGAKGRGASAAAHSSYITAQEQYERKRGVVMTEAGNMPEWAEADPARFWAMADENERANANTYKELELALPRELDRQEQVELLRGFVTEQLGEKHAYQWALHDKGDGNPHAHVMFSERQRDGIERDPEQYFKRANKKAPEKGGALKSNEWNQVYNPETREKEASARLLKARESWADAQNRALERAGQHVRVDSRSLEAQGIDRTPGKHLGPRALAVAEKELRQDPAFKAEVKTTAAELAGARRELANLKSELALVVERDRKARELAEVESKLAEARKAQEAQKAPHKAQEQTARSKAAATPEKVQEAPKAAQTPSPERKQTRVVNSELWAKAKAAKEATKTEAKPEPAQTPPATQKAARNVDELRAQFGLPSKQTEQKTPAPATEKAAPRSATPERPKTQIHKSAESLREQKAAEVRAKLEKLDAKPEAAKAERIASFQADLEAKLDKIFAKVAEKPQEAARAPEPAKAEAKPVQATKAQEAPRTTQPGKELAEIGESLKGLKHYEGVEKQLNKLRDLQNDIAAKCQPDVAGCEKRLEAAKAELQTVSAEAHKTIKENLSVIRTNEKNLESAKNPGRFERLWRDTKKDIKTYENKIKEAQINIGNATDDITNKEKRVSELKQAVAKEKEYVNVYKSKDRIKQDFIETKNIKQKFIDQHLKDRMNAKAHLSYKDLVGRVGEKTADNMLKEAFGEDYKKVAYMVKTGANAYIRLKTNFGEKLTKAALQQKTYEMPERLAKMMENVRGIREQKQEQTER